MLKRSDIRIRDPFILTDRAHGCYYMYGTTALHPGGLGTYPQWSVYKTHDLEHFEEPKVIFDPADHPNFWGTRDFWAAEVHEYRGKYYLFGTCKNNDGHMGTMIFVCDTPDGRFAPLSDAPVTPLDWQCLDGTLWVENGTPYMVFCHEWGQVKDGQICAIPLSDDLTRAVGAPVILFRASENPFVSELHNDGQGNYVTDGPFLFRDGDTLRMIWSSFIDGHSYAVFEAEADTLLDPWTHRNSRFPFDGGHAMIFETLNGARMISLHAPNRVGEERPFFAAY